MKAGFLYSTKDRHRFTQRSFPSLDVKGIDILWVDGSASPYELEPRHARLIEVHRGVNGGPDPAIRLGLSRLLDLGYDYCGIVENDTLLHPGWYSALMKLFTPGVGAATVKTIASRVLEYHAGHAELWNIGASMVLFTREAARIVLDTYGETTASRIRDYFYTAAGVDLSDRWELFQDQPDRILGTDWAHVMELHRRGLKSVGTIPAMMAKLDGDLATLCRTHFVTGL